MKQPESSRQSQSPLRDAQNSVDALENAVHQVESHPSAEMVWQADNALNRAENAMLEANDDLNQKAAKETSDRLQNAKSILEKEYKQLSEE
jgi:hypothetical protein